MSSNTENIYSELDGVTYSVPGIFRWLPTSDIELADAESTILKRLKCSLDSFFVKILGSYFIRTHVARNFINVPDDIAKSKECLEERVPMVLLHGFASGSGLWCKNIDNLSLHRRVYCFDMLGFGRSSRPDFPTGQEKVEQFFVDVIENWRNAVNLDKFILVGHSMGGFLAAAYALKYSQRVVHLVLVDPWGFIGQSESKTFAKMSSVKRMLFRTLANIKPLSIMRLMGPFGPNLMRKLRYDVAANYTESTDCDSESYGIQNDTKTDNSDLSYSMISSTTESSAMNKGYQSALGSSAVYNYIYHINAQYPSGENAFYQISEPVGWAAHPMLHRILNLDPQLPITFIYGGRSWMDMSSGLRIRNLRPNSYVDVMVIEGGGHQAYAQHADEFNAYVNALAALVDERHVFRMGSELLVQSASRQGCPQPINRGMGARCHSQLLPRDSSPSQSRRRTSSIGDSTSLDIPD